MSRSTTTASPPCSVSTHQTHLLFHNGDLGEWYPHLGDSFPYLFLVAVETGSLLYDLLLRALPFTSSFHVLSYVALAGLPMHEVFMAVVPLRLMAGDVREDAWRALKGCGERRVLVTAWPNAMVGAIVKRYLGGEVELVGSDVEVESGGVVGVWLLDGTLKKELMDVLFLSGCLWEPWRSNVRGERSHSMKVGMDGGVS